jgi:Mn2+/Fe2+ NRAMP family transporter
MLRWLTLALLAYVATALAVPVDWSEVAGEMLVPRVEFSGSYLTMVTAVFGTTIAPYLVFWQAAEEVEDLGGSEPGDLGRDAAARRREFRRIRLDTWFGIGFSNLVGLSVIIATAATLHRAGITDIKSAEQAAAALRPLAGDLSFFAFSAGIIGTGLLAVPVLAGSAAYAVGEALGRPVGLSRRPREARTFYGVIAAATIIGTALHFSPIDPMAALVASAVLNGVLVVPILAALLIVGSSRRVMGSALPSWRLRALAGTALLVMGAAAVALVASWFR